MYSTFSAISRLMKSVASRYLDFREEVTIEEHDIMIVQKVFKLDGVRRNTDAPGAPPGLKRW